MTRKMLAALALVLWMPLMATTQDKTGEVALGEVKYDVLKDIVLKNRGKVVLVDFWYNT